MDEAIRKTILTVAREIMLNEPLSPMLFLSKEGRVVAILPLALLALRFEKEQLFKNLSEKEKNRFVMRYAGSLVRERGIEFDSIYVVQEGWMLRADAFRSGEEFTKWLLEKRIQDHPEKVEVLTLSYSEGMGKHEVEAIPFFQTPEGPVVEQSISSKMLEVESILLDNFWDGYRGKGRRINF